MPFITIVDMTINNHAIFCIFDRIIESSIMKHLKYLLLSLFIVACSGKKDVIPDKSIFEPLTVDELSTIIKQDTLFVDFYESIQEEVDDYTDIEKAKFNDVTYRSLYRACQKIFDRDMAVEFTAPYWDEWHKRFDIDHAKVDSLMAYWEKYRAEHNFQDMVTVEVVDLVKDTRYSTTEVYMVVRVTPVAGSLKNVNIDYTTRFKGMRDQREIAVYPSTDHGYLWLYDIQGVREEKKLLDYQSRQYLKERTFEDFKNDFDVEFRVTSVTIGNDLYMEDDSVYPENVLRVLKQGPYSPGSMDGYIEDVIKSNIDPNYVDGYTYVQNRVMEYFEKNHPQEYAFMRYTEKRSKRR